MNFSKHLPHSNFQPVGILELIDHSIAAHFPHFDFPHWELLNPELPPTSQENPSESEGQDVISTPDYSEQVEEEQLSAPEYVPYVFQREPSPSAPPFQEDDEIPSPLPSTN